MLQILVWGGSFFLLAVMGEPITRDTGWAAHWVYGSLSLSLMVAAFLAPLSSRLVARHGGRIQLACSGAIVALGLLMVAAGVGLPYAIGNALCGGTAEYVALVLRGAGVESYFYYCVAAMSAIALLAAVLMPDLRKHGYLDGAGTVEENTGLRGRSDYASARS